MKRILTLPVLMGAAIVLAATSAPSAQAGMAMQAETIDGVLVDTKCYGMMPEQNAGNDHMVEQHGTIMNVENCAVACATMGIPVALRTADDRTVVLAAPASQLSKHMAQRVSLVGMYSTDHATFIVTRVIPEDGEPYDITTMM